MNKNYNDMVNKESVEALTTLTELMSKADPEKKIIKYETETLNNLSKLVNRVDGVSIETKNKIANLNKETRNKNQKQVMEFASNSKPELDFSLPPKVCSELYEIIKNINKEQVLKIPKIYIRNIIDNRDVENPVEYDWNRPIIEQDFEEGTLKFLNWICLNFWLETEEEKKQWIEKYNTETTSLIEKKETLFEKIKSMFKNM